jgi:hypothetical protein
MQTVLRSVEVMFALVAVERLVVAAAVAAPVLVEMLVGHKVI